MRIASRMCAICTASSLTSIFHHRIHALSGPSCCVCFCVPASLCLYLCRVACLPALFLPRETPPSMQNESLWGVRDEMDETDEIDAIERRGTIDAITAARRPNPLPRWRIETRAHGCAWLCQPSALVRTSDCTCRQLRGGWAGVKL